MKIIKKDIRHDAITIMPQYLDDFWVLYNIIEKGDQVYAKTRREIRLGTRYDQSEKGKRISVYLGIKVERVAWDRTLNRIRIHGIIFEAPETVGAGSHHTINIRLNKALKIVKKNWPSYQIERIERATKERSPPIILISIDDEGYCVSNMRGFGLEIKTEKQLRLPGKAHPNLRSKNQQELFKSATRSLEELGISGNQSIVVLGIGYIKDSFIKYLKEKKRDIYEKIIDVKSVNSSGKAGIFEAVRSGILGKAVENVRFMEETKIVESILERLGKGERTVTFGLNEVSVAADYGAVEKLVVSDIQLRSATDDKRKTLEKIMKVAEKKGAEIVIVSTEHEAGEKLNSLSGIAALLRFPIFV